MVFHPGVWVYVNITRAMRHSARGGMRGINRVEAQVVHHLNGVVRMRAAHYWLVGRILSNFCDVVMDVDEIYVKLMRD